MKEYTVHIGFTGGYDVVIKTENEKEALEIAEYKFDCADILGSDAVFGDATLEIVDTKEIDED